MRLSSENYLRTIIIGIALLTSLTGILFLLILDFDGIEFNGDSHVYFLNAEHFLSALSIPEFPKSTYWPYGYPALVSLACTIGDLSFETARWVNVIFGGLLALVFCMIAVFIARFNQNSRNDAILLIVSIGILPLGHGLFLKYQLTMMSDMTSAFLNVLTILLCWKSRNTGSLITTALAGFVLGLSLLTRYVNALMLVPALTALLYGNNFGQLISFRKSILPVTLFGIAALITFAPQLYITLQDTSSSLGNGLLNDWSVRNFFSLSHESIDGSQTAKIPSVLYYLLLPFRWQCFTPLGIALLFLGIRYSLRELPGWISFSIVAWYGIHYLLLCGIPLQNSRIGFPLFLPVTVWLSLGILESKISWSNHFGKTAILITVVWLTSLAVSFKAAYDFIRIKNDLKNTAQTVVKNIPSGSRIISTSLFAVYKAYPMKVEPYSIYTLRIKETKRLLDNPRPAFLAIDEKHFIPQWSNYPPGETYRWIKNNYFCRIAFVADDYTVYEIKPKNILQP